MNLLATLALAFSMSADAFAAALGKGAALDKPRLTEALRAGLIFGFIEAITPVIGWGAGITASRFIGVFDHWIAFIVLGVIGGKMIWESVHRHDGWQKPMRHSLGVLISTAIGTSIDAMAVGITLALIGANIIVAALAIGATTFALATLGHYGRPTYWRQIWPHRGSGRRDSADFDRRQDPGGSHSRRLVES